jgi:hypothetical protein
MNMGVWWTPYIAADLDGDGKAEVALEMAPTQRPRKKRKSAPAALSSTAPSTSLS